MRTFAQKPRASQEAASPGSVRPGRTHLWQGRASASRLARDLSQVPVQAKLTIGSPGDAYEREADHVANTMMRMPEPSVQDRKLDLLQAKPAHGNVTGAGVAPREVHQVLNAQGQPLETGPRSFFEPRFGRDFSQVRLHTNQEAAQAAQAVNALAFTVGSDIFFGAGRYQPQTEAGRSLLAHELTHVVQQGGSRQTLMRACDCKAIGGRAPNSSDPLEDGVSKAFPGLVTGDWCVLQSPTPKFNCYAWSISDTTQWIDTQVDSVYGDKDGKLSFADFDAFYEKTQGLRPQQHPDSNTMVALYAKGSDPQHAALVAGIESCGSIPFTSKLGQGPLIAHDMNQLEGSTYGKAARFYGT